MKKLLIAILLITLLSGCSNYFDSYGQKNSEQNFSEKQANISNQAEELIQVDKNKNYEVYAICKDDILYDYCFAVYNNQGEEFDSGSLLYSEPKFDYITDTIIKRTISYGTDNANEVKYYDLEKSIVSPTYTGVYCDNSNVVISIEYNNDIPYLLVKSIFSGEILLNQPIDTENIYTSRFEITIDNNIIKVTHSKGGDYTTVTDIFSLSNL